MKDEIVKNAKILIIDDHEANVRVLELMLRRAGYHQYESLTDPRLVMQHFADFQPDLLLLDLLMPHLDGFAVMEQLRPLVAAETFLPILVLTADVTPETKRKALAAGAKDFLSKPFDVVEILLRIGNLLETRFLYQELYQQNQSLEERVLERTAELERANGRLQAEIVVREQAEKEIGRLNGELERLLAERTSQLEKAQKKLRELNIKIDDSHSEKHLEVITETDYFKQLETNAKSLRNHIKNSDSLDQ
jgi:putative two-component system response regulator